jgi:hypothetical protein
MVISKPMKFREALQRLDSMHFGVRVVKSGRCRGVKEIWWTTLDGLNTGARFVRETDWGAILDYAEQQLPVWDRAMMFQSGDIIEFDWQGRTTATVIDLTSNHHYILQSSVFQSGWCGCRRQFGNYDLRFFRNAVKVAELEF